MANRIMDIMILSTCIGLAVLICYGMLGNVKGGNMDPGVAFPWHPILMTTTFTGFMVMGRWSYCADPCWGLEEKQQRRWIHASLMGVAVVAAVAGYVCIFISHWKTKQYFGYNFETGKWEDNKTRIAHSLLGYIALTLSLAQGLMGPIKMMRLNMGERVLTFHGTLGKVIIIVGAANVGLAIQFWGWDTNFKIILGLLTFAVALVGVAYPTHVEKKLDEETPMVA